MANEINANEFVKGIPKLAKGFESLSKEIKEFRVELSKTQKLFDKSSKSQSDVTKKAKAVSKAVSQMSDVEKELERVRKKSLKTTKEVIKAQELEKKRVKALREEVQKEIGVTKQKTSFTQKLTKSIKAGVLQAVAYIAAIKGIITVAQKYIENVAELNAHTTKTIQLFGLSREAAFGLTKDIRALSAAWGKDFNDVLKSSNILSKEFGITGTKALGLIRSGFEKGADVNGEFLELLKEYPAQLKAVGLSAKQSIALITQTERQGLFSDKGIDAIKEAGIRLRELTPATESALEAIGLSGAEIQRQLRSGEKTLFEVTQMVSEKLAELPPQSKEVGTAIADIFGGPGEDVGLTFLSTLKDINLELSSIEENSAPLERAARSRKEAFSQLNDEVSKGTSLFSKLISVVQLRLGLAATVINTTLQGEEKIKKAKEEREIEETKALEKVVVKVKETEEKRTKIVVDEQLKRIGIQVTSEEELQDELLNNWIAYYNKKETLAEDDSINQKQLLADTLEFSEQLANTFFDFKNNLRDLELQDLDIQKDAELARAGDSAAEKERIENKFAEKQKKLKTEQAKADKRQAAFNIAIATAQAVISALASVPPNVPLSIFAGVLGAAQLTAVAAQPIPKFKHGGTMQKDGFAQFSEEGSELAVLPGGKAVLTPSEETISLIPKGTTFFKHDSPETQAALSGGMSDEHYNGLIAEQRLTRKAIQAKSTQPIISEKGLERIDSNKKQRTNYLDRNFR